MDIRNCRNCGRIYNYVTGPNVCPRCAQELEDKFQEVKKYIYDHPGTTVNEVAIENDVSVKQIRLWVRQERLEFSAATATGILCENCGKPIQTGRFCKHCKESMIHNLGSAYTHSGEIEQDKRSTGNPKMRYLNQED